jgi:hypothetical protein
LGCQKLAIVFSKKSNDKLYNVRKGIFFWFYGDLYIGEFWALFFSKQRKRYTGLEIFRYAMRTYPVKYLGHWSFYPVFEKNGLVPGV